MFGWGTWIPAKTRVADQKPLACSAFLSSRGGRVSALWTMFVDQRKAHRRRPRAWRLTRGRADLARHLRITRRRPT